MVKYQCCKKEQEEVHSHLETLFGCYPGSDKLLQQETAVVLDETDRILRSVFLFELFVQTHSELEENYH